MNEEEPKVIENKELTEQEKIFYADLFIKNCNETFNKIENDGCLSISVYKSDIQAIRGLLDLYQTEKEKNKKLELETIPLLEGKNEGKRIAIDELKKELQAEKEKSNTFEQLLQGNLYEMYKHYRDLCSSYQANSISKDKIKEKIKEVESHKEKFKNSKINYEELYSFEVDIHQIDVLKELLEE